MTWATFYQKKKGRANDETFFRFSTSNSGDHALRLSHLRYSFHFIFFLISSLLSRVPPSVLLSIIRLPSAVKRNQPPRLTSEEIVEKWPILVQENEMGRFVHLVIYGLLVARSKI